MYKQYNNNDNGNGSSELSLSGDYYTMGIHRTAQFIAVPPSRTRGQPRSTMRVIRQPVTRTRSPLTSTTLGSPNVKTGSESKNWNNIESRNRTLMISDDPQRVTTAETVPEMTYNVSSGTLSLYSPTLIQQVTTTAANDVTTTTDSVTVRPTTTTTKHHYKTTSTISDTNTTGGATTEAASGDDDERKDYAEEESDDHEDERFEVDSSDDDGDDKDEDGGDDVSVYQSLKSEQQNVDTSRSIDSSRGRVAALLYRGIRYETTTVYYAVRVRGVIEINHNFNYCHLVSNQTETRKTRSTTQSLWDRLDAFDR